MKQQAFCSNCGKKIIKILTDKNINKNSFCNIFCINDFGWKLVLSKLGLDYFPQHISKEEIESHDNYISKTAPLVNINLLPIGTKFHVINGAWEGQIIEKDNEKYIKIHDDDMPPSEITDNDVLVIQIL